MNKGVGKQDAVHRACQRLRDITCLEAEIEAVNVAAFQNAEFLKVDAVLIITPPTLPPLRFVAQEKRHLTTQNIETTLNQVRQAAHALHMAPLIVAEYINTNITQRLREEKINYLDAAGNAHLRGPGLFVDVQGQRALPLTEVPRPPGRKGLQLITLLLARPEYLDITAREQATAAGIALGTVPLTLQELENRGLLRRTGPRQLAIKDPEQLLALWIEGYTQILRPRLVMHRYRLAPDVPLKELPAALRKAGLHDILVGGEAAAALYTNYLNPGGATLHVYQPELKLPARLLVPDAHGNVDLLHGFGAAADLWAGPLEGLIHPLLVYGELLATGGHDRRLTETAEQLRNKFHFGQPGADGQA